MTSRAKTPIPEGKVRWRRLAGLGLPALGLTGVLVLLTAQGVLAAQFAISGIPFTVAADRLDGVGFEQFGGLDNVAAGSPNLADQNGQVLVMVSAIHTATVTNLCQSVNLGGFFLVIRAGNQGTPVKATNLVLDSDTLTGDSADFNNIAIGQDASTLTAVPGITGPIGDFAQQADTVAITNVRQNNWSATAATFALPNLSMTFKDTGC
jgi:hypothetical protein